MLYEEVVENIVDEHAHEYEVITAQPGEHYENI